MLDIFPNHFLIFTFQILPGRIVHIKKEFGGGGEGGGTQITLCQKFGIMYQVTPWICLWLADLRSWQAIVNLYCGELCGADIKVLLPQAKSDCHFRYVLKRSCDVRSD